MNQILAKLQDVTPDSRAISMGTPTRPSSRPGSRSGARTPNNIRPVAGSRLTSTLPRRKNESSGDGDGPSRLSAGAVGVTELESEYNKGVPVSLRKICFYFIFRKLIICVLWKNRGKKISRSSEVRAFYTLNHRSALGWLIMTSPQFRGLNLAALQGGGKIIALLSAVNMTIAVRMSGQWVSTINSDFYLKWVIGPENGHNDI